MADAEVHPRVLAALNTSAIPFRVVRHSDLCTPVQNPHDVARALGYEVNRITKTLFLRTPEKSVFFIAVLGVTQRADLPGLAGRFGATRCSVATPAELETLLGYPRGGVSPLDARTIPVFLNSALRQHDSILVGAGTPGVEIDISPHDLATVCGGEWVAFSQTG